MLPPDTDPEDVIRYLDDALPMLLRRGSYEMHDLASLARDMIAKMLADKEIERRYTDDLETLIEGTARNMLKAIKQGAHR